MKSSSLTRAPAPATWWHSTSVWTGRPLSLFSRMVKEMGVAVAAVAAVVAVVEVVLELEAVKARGSFNDFTCRGRSAYKVLYRTEHNESHSIYCMLFYC